MNTVSENNSQPSEILTLLSKSQKSESCHEKYSLILLRIYRNHDLEVFWAQFIKPLNFLLTYNPKLRNPDVERIIRFIGLFYGKLNYSTSSEEDNNDDNPLISKTLIYLLKATEHTLETVRYRSCQIINCILNNLVGFSISEELNDEMQKVLLNRLWDPRLNVRLEAVHALYRLQDPTDSDDEITENFVKMLDDGHAKIRFQVVSKIAINRETLALIILRTRDINVDVRLAAYERLKKIPKLVTISNKRNILQAAIGNKNDKVLHFIYKKLLNTWYEFYDSDILKLLKSFRFDADENDIKITRILYENILSNFYFKLCSPQEIWNVLPLTDVNLLPYNEFNLETITFWRFLLANKYLCDENEPEKKIPEVVLFCNHLKGFLVNNNDLLDSDYLLQQYIIKQLFIILKNFNYFDDVFTSKNVCSIIVHFLEIGGFMDDVLEVIFDVLKLIYPDYNKRCMFVLEIINNLLYPVNEDEELKKQQELEQENFQISELKVQLNILKEDQRNAVSASNYLEADKLMKLIEDCQKQIKSLNNSVANKFHDENNCKKVTDELVICNILDILHSILRSVNKLMIHPTLVALKTEFLIELLFHQNDIVKVKAWKCFAIYCICDKSTAIQGVHIFTAPILAYQSGEECNNKILEVCMMTLMDLLLIYGKNELMAEPNQDQLLSESINEDFLKTFTGGVSLTSVVQGMLDLLYDEQLEIQYLACTVLGKLILCERIYSGSIIANLILKWAIPEDDFQASKIKQLIGVALEKLPYLRNIAKPLEKGILLTIESFTNAPKTSPLITVDIKNIMKFLLALCNSSPQGETIKFNLINSLCTCMNLKPDDNKININYSKLLVMCDLNENWQNIEDLYQLVETCRENISDRICLANLTKVLSNLALLIQKKRRSSLIEINPNNNNNNNNQNNRREIETIQEQEEEEKEEDEEDSTETE